MSLIPPPKLKKLQEALYASAKQNKERRFHQLYDKMYREDLLAHAYVLSRANGGAPGVDGQRFEDIEDYGREKWLQELGHELRTETYRPQAVRRVMIPKAGGTGERPLGIPTVKDRVAQTVAKLLLEPIFEADFDDAAYGYRPGRSAQQAVKLVHATVLSGHVEVVDADLSKYFDTIPHAELLKSVARRISDGKMLRLIKLWLKVPVEEKDDRGHRRMSGGKKSTTGTPQGGVISPLLANIYMHRFIKAFRRSKLAEQHGAVLVTYADDLVVLCRRGAPRVLAIISGWMTRIGLKMNEEKTRVCNASDGFNFLGYTFRPAFSRRTGQRYHAAFASEKALVRLKDNVRGLLHRGNMDRWDVVVAQLNRKLKGWRNYFNYGTTSGVFDRVDFFIEGRVRAFLRRRHKLPTHSAALLPRKKIFGQLGVYSLRERTT